MKRKIVAFAAILLMSVGVAMAHPIKITTSCGKKVTVESDDYSNTEDVNDALLIDAALCP